MMQALAYITSSIASRLGLSSKVLAFETKLSTKPCTFPVDISADKSSRLLHTFFDYR